SPDPDAYLIFADRAVVHDQHQGQTYLLALAADGDTTPARRWLDATERRLAGCAPLAEPARPQGCAGRARLRHDRAAYLELIEAWREEIRAGESYEVCLTNTVEVDATLDAWPAYRWLRRAHPAPHGALLRLGDLSVLSFSPERFLRVGRDGAVESRPIKGT